MTADYHLHSCFSGDSETPTEEVVRSGLEKGLSLLCLTEHFDPDYPYADVCMDLDAPAYFAEARRLQALYESRIEIRVGAELALPVSYTHLDVYKRQYHHSIDTKLHHGTIESQDSFRLRKIRADVFCRRAEFLFLIVFTHKRFHHAHGLDIFLNGTVQIIVLFKYLFEQRHGPADHKGQPSSQKRNGQKENPCHSSSHDKRHGKGKNQHQRGAHRHTDNHHVSPVSYTHLGKQV